MKKFKSPTNMLLPNLKSFYKFFSSKYQTVHLEYKVDSKPRFESHKAPSNVLYEIINENYGDYEYFLKSILKYAPKIQEIKKAVDETDSSKVMWNNGFLPGLDIVTLYGMIAELKPANYVEIGSGNSTKVVKKAIIENGLKTKITSIDPFPRADIDSISDIVFRTPLEKIESATGLVQNLTSGDILFIDNSHRVFPNSDALVCFLELIPALNKGVIVHIHDIYLPYDYPQFMCDRFYNEQYFLACMLMANPAKYQTILPNYFISEDHKLSSILGPIWDHPNLSGVERHGGSFWFKIN